MECKKVKRLLSAYLDSSLKASVQDAIKEHLAKCGKCRDELNTMSKIDNLLKLKIKEKPSKEYWESYWLKLESKLMRYYVGYPTVADIRISTFKLAFNGILIAVLIFLSGLLYINTQQIKLLQLSQEEMQKEMCRDLFHLRTRGNPAGISYETNPVDIINGTRSNLPTLRQPAVKLAGEQAGHSYGVNVQIPLEIVPTLRRDVHSPNSDLFLTGQILDRYRYRYSMIYSKFTIKKEG